MMARVSQSVKDERLTRDQVEGPRPGFEGGHTQGGNDIL